MAVTTEPPTLHKSQGVAPRNGTATHVINFTTDGDAPFTPATGSLLVVFIGGGVTNAASGWTEVEQPVSSGELSCFTKNSAPDTSITVTHNASNYPCPWVVKEYPAGSAVTSSTSSNASNDTFPTLSGLTGGAGNERVIDAAFLRVADGGESGFSAVWGGSFVEDADQYIAQSPTDGAGFTSGHLINVTATSSTPSITPTYGGTWTINDREKIVVAINAVAPPTTTPFTKDYTISWDVRNTFTKDYTVTWQVRNLLAKDYTLAWQVRNSFNKDHTVSWDIRNLFAKDYTLVWDVQSGTSFTKDYTITWQIRNSITKDYQVLWDVRNDFTKDYQVLWAVRSLIAKDYQIVWDILGASGFVKDYQVLWNIRNNFAKDYQILWRILATGAITFYMWDGASETILTVEGVWNGTTVVPYDTLEIS